MARGLGNQNMKRYHMWNLSHQDISNKVRSAFCFWSASLGCLPLFAYHHSAVVQFKGFSGCCTIQGFQAVEAAGLMFCSRFCGLRGTSSSPDCLHVDS